MYTQLWNYQFIKNTSFIERNSFLNVLEVGCYEALTSNFIVNNLLAHNGVLVCVDPLADNYELDNDNDLFKGQYGRFIENIAPNKDRVRLIRDSSITALPFLRDNHFDFIYVDGDHTLVSVVHDGRNAFRLCKPGGYILFDDYTWGTNKPVKEAVDQVLQEFTNYRLLLKLNQVLIQKLPEGSPTEDGQDEYQNKTVEILFADDKIYAAYCNLDSRPDRNLKMMNELRRIGF